MSNYPLITDHGLIGNPQRVALISSDGTIDWFCAPLASIRRAYSAACWTMSAVDICVLDRRSPPSRGSSGENRTRMTSLEDENRKALATPFPCMQRKRLTMVNRE
jgi:hypothetical protein